MTAHALLSASSSKRWLTCTPSARLESTLPEQKQVENAFSFSEEGTIAHALADNMLKYAYNQISEEEYNAEFNKIKESKYYCDEMQEYIDGYVVYVRSQIGEDDRPLFEQRVDFSDWVPDGFGTADVIILSKHKVRVIDLKYGKGVPVYATDNSQLRLYALGAFAKFKEEFPGFKEAEYTICQPRLDSISSDSTTVEKLLDWANYFVKPKAKKAWVGTGDFLPGDHCQFCRAKSQCRARSDFVNDLAKLEFRPPPLLTDTEIEQVLDRVDSISSWANDVKAFVLDRAVKQNIIPTGFKLSTTKAHRKLADQVLAAQVLMEKGFKEEEIYEPKNLKSIAQLEKLGNKGQVSSILGDLILRPDGSPKLVRDTSVKEDFT